MTDLSAELRAHMAALGRKGGKRSLETMTPAQRQARGRKAGRASKRARDRLKRPESR